MAEDRIAIEREGGVAHVSLTRDDKMNAMDGAMFAAIGEAFRTLGADSSVRCILLSGRGRHFTAGLDLDYAGSNSRRRRIPGAPPRRGCGTSSGCRIASLPPKKRARR